MCAGAFSKRTAPDEGGGAFNLVANPLRATDAVSIAKRRGFACVRPKGRRRGEYRHRPLADRRPAARWDIERTGTHRLQHPADPLAPTIRMARDREREQDNRRCERLKKQP